MASTDRRSTTWRSIGWTSTQLAAVLAATVVVASMLSVELGFSVALIELGPTPLSDRSARQSVDRSAVSLTR